MERHPLLFISLLWVSNSCGHKNKYINKHTSNMENKNTATFFHAVWWGRIWSFCTSRKALLCISSNFSFQAYISAVPQEPREDCRLCYSSGKVQKDINHLHGFYCHHQAKLLIMSMFHISSNLFLFPLYDSAGNSESISLQRGVGIYFKR